jgi:hypothetical protein
MIDRHKEMMMANQGDQNGKYLGKQGIANILKTIELFLWELMVLILRRLFLAAIRVITTAGWLGVMVRLVLPFSRRGDLLLWLPIRREYFS